MTSHNEHKWQDVCQLTDILPNMGRCALFNNRQVAIFRVANNSLPESEQFYATDNYCPFSDANIISRGIVGNIGNSVVVASPLYKQHFDLSTGACLEDISVSLSTYPVRLKNGVIQLAA